MPLRTAFKARYVFPVVSPPLADGVVTVENGVIIAVGRQAGDDPLTDLGNVALLPGLVNAHTHLEFSGLARPLGAPGMAFADWARLVIAHRSATPSKLDDSTKGATESTQRAVVALGEIATSPWSPPPGLGQATVFLEAIGLTRERIEPKLAEARRHFAAGGTTWRPGLSPHAPYSVHPELFDGLLALASAAEAPIAFHLAETLEELELLASGEGPLRKFLIDLGAWDAAAIPRGTRPLDYLRRLAASGVHALVIHGNYLEPDEIGLLAAHNRLTVVYCPRTHAYFGHPAHPLPRLLAAGANVALGTDSRASNPDLNLLEEMRFVARRFPEISPNLVLELATLRAARALQLEKNWGSIEVGKTAAFALLPLADRDVADPHRLIYESDQPAAPFSP
jgi:aminodeoxyfutalosine deaminase